nr:Transposon Ty3-G Gag-Pol polyprotein [Ipomoea batatas]
MNRVTGVSENQLVSYIIGGLKPHLKRELLIARPDTIAAIFKLAKAHEARHVEIIAETAWLIGETLGYELHWENIGADDDDAKEADVQQVEPTLPAVKLLQVTSLCSTHLQGQIESLSTCTVETASRREPDSKELRTPRARRN